MEAPKLIEGLSHEVIVSAACGRNHTLALTGKEWLASAELGRRPHGPLWALGWSRLWGSESGSEGHPETPVGASRSHGWPPHPLASEGGREAEAGPLDPPCVLSLGSEGPVP